jgi:hypothetical protein
MLSNSTQASSPWAKAEEYQLEGLKVRYEDALSKTPTSRTIIDNLLLADTHNAQKIEAVEIESYLCLR